MRKTAKSRAYYILTLLFLIYLFDFADRKILSVLFPLIKADWNLSDMQLSMLEGVTSITIAICVIPMAILVDRWSRKKMIVIMVFAWSLVTILCAFANNYTQLLLLRGLIGIGEAAYAPAAIAMISKFFPIKHRAKYIGIYDAAAPLGVAIGMILGGYIGMVYGWRHAFGLVAIPGILLSLLFLFVRDYKTLPLYYKNTRSSFQFSHVKDLLQTKTLWFIYIAFACMVGINTSVLDWAPSFFMRIHGLTQSESGYVSAIIAGSVLIGAPLGGYYGDKLSLKFPHGKLLISGITTCGAGLALLGAVSTSNLYVSFVCFGLFGIQTVAFLGPASAIIQEIVQPGIRTLAFGINVLIMNILGSFAMILLVGYISDKYDLQVALEVIACFAFFASFLFFVSKNNYLHDLNAINRTVSNE